MGFCNYLSLLRPPFRFFRWFFARRLFRGFFFKSTRWICISEPGNISAKNAAIASTSFGTLCASGFLYSLLRSGCFSIWTAGQTSIIGQPLQVFTGFVFAFANRFIFPVVHRSKFVEIVPVCACTCEHFHCFNRNAG